MPRRKIPDEAALPYHVRECMAVVTLTKQLGELAYLQDALDWGRALIARTGEATCLSTSCLESEPADTLVDRVRLRVIHCLLARHRPIFREAETALGLSLCTWANGLEQGLDGTWEDAARYIIGAHAARLLQARDSACPWFGVSDSEESRDALYEALRAAAETNMITLAGLAPGEDSEDYLAQAARSLRAYVQRSQAAPSREPRKGGRPRGQPNRLKDDEEAADERYKRRVVLCNLWRQTPTEYRDRRDLWSGSPTKTWSEFLDLVNRSRLLSKSYTSQKTLERATIDALKWGAPLPGFLDLDRFVLG